MLALKLAVFVLNQLDSPMNPLLLGQRPGIFPQVGLCQPARGKVNHGEALLNKRAAPMVFYAVPMVFRVCYGVHCLPVS
jgi:hypothetical protein